MDIARFMPNFGSKNVELTEEELDEQDKKAKEARTSAGKHGPRSVKYMTNGQYRRMLERGAKTEKRKANRRHRRNWLAAQEEFSRLRGRVLVTQGIIPATADGQRNAHLGLIREFGVFDDEGWLTNDPVEAAQAHLDAIAKLGGRQTSPSAA